MAHPPRKPTPPPPRRSGGLGLWVRRLSRLAGTLAMLSIFQVFLARFLTPPLSWTMVDRAWTEHSRSGRWRWVDHESRSLDELGEAVARAAVASEDAHFWFHHGFDLDGICRAVARNDRKGETVAGGSTITQQVARNVFLWQGRSWLRKGLEAWYTIWLELLVPKERILELYLNVAETGPMTFGVEAGARRAFGVSAALMSQAQAAALVATLPSPLKWAVDGDTAQKRATWILSNPAPFPGDRGYDEAWRAWEAEPAIPESCRRAIRSL